MSTVRIVVPFQKETLPHENFFESFADKHILHTDARESGAIAILADEDTQVDMDLAYMGLFAFVHGKELPETHDFFHSSEYNQFRHEKKKEFYSAFKPVRDDETEVMGSITVQEIKDYAFAIMKDELKKLKS